MTAATPARWLHEFRSARGKSNTESSERGSSSLLHNMSVPPQSFVIHHDRRGRLGGSGLCVSSERLPKERTLRSLLKLFTEEPVPAADVEHRLRREILIYAATAGLPPAALVLEQAAAKDLVCDDPRLIVCVLSQASRRVYLRDKEPNLSQLFLDRSLVVLASPESSS